jgi:hypothetical protein
VTTVEEVEATVGEYHDATGRAQLSRHLRGIVEVKNQT